MIHKEAIDEKIVLEWANGRAGESTISGFGDSELSDSVFIMDLLNAMRPGIVNWTLVHGIDSPDDQMHNAKYVISVARKIGCAVFLTWEDIVNVNRKMLFTLFATLMAQDIKYQQSRRR